MIEERPATVAQQPRVVEQARGGSKPPREIPAASVLSTSARDLAYVAFKWKRDVVLIVLLAAIGAAFYLWMFRDTLYESNVRLLVKLGQEQAPPPTMLGDRTLLISQRPQDVTSEIDVLTSTDLLQQVVLDLGMDQPSPPDPVPAEVLPRVVYELKQAKTKSKDGYKELQILLGMRRRLTPTQEAVAVLQAALQVEAKPESNILVASLYTPLSEGAGAILNAIIDEYLEFRRSLFVNDQSVEYFQGQVSASLNELRQAEQAAATFEQERDLQNLSAEETLLLTAHQDLLKRYKEAEVLYQVAQQKLQRFGSVDPGDMASYSTVGGFEEGSYPSAIMLKLLELTQQRQDLPSGNAPTEMVTRIERQRATLLETLQNYLRADETEKRQQHQILKAMHDDNGAKLDRILDAQTEWSDVQRKVKVAQDNYYFYQQRLEDSVAVAAMQRERIGNISVVQHAMDPVKPIGISKYKLFLFGFVFAFFAALAWAAVREYFDHTINSADQLGTLVGAPVLASIPVTPRSTKR